MSGGDAGVRYVLCCDDHDGAGAFDEAFEADRERRRDLLGESAERLVRLYEPCQTARRAMADLSLAARDGAHVDAILVDDHLKSGIPREPEPQALALVKAITERYGADRPLCVLWTANPDPGVVYTFCELGGHHYADKTWGWQECTKVIWAALAGERWQPRPDRSWRSGDPDLSPRERLLLPYLEADWPADLIAADLTASGRLGEEIPSARVHDWRRQLARKLGVPLRGQTVALANRAREAGYDWVPLSYRHLLPSDHPEHGERTAPAAALA